MKTIDISRDVDKYLCMTQVCMDVSLGALAMKHGSMREAIKAWNQMKYQEAAHRNDRSLVRPDHGGGR